MRTYVACLNAGDQLRLAALESDAYLRWLLTGQAIDATWGTPTPLPRAARLVDASAQRPPSPTGTPWGEMSARPRAGPGGRQQ